MSDKKTFSAEEVAKHSAQEDCWLIVDGKVYDVTKYLNDHPGGPEILLDFAGKDATDMFEDIGHSSGAREKLRELYLGDLEGSAVGAPKKKEIKSRGGLNPMAVVLLLVAIAVGIYFTQKK